MDAALTAPDDEGDDDALADEVRKLGGVRNHASPARFSRDST
jgi:hypothetical protein